MTVYWFVWDAAAAWVVDELDAEGSLPHVRALRSAGVRAAGRPPAPNCQTPPSLATLFTGTSSQEHGVTGFSVPTGLTGHTSGFDPAYPARPPVWRSPGVRGAFVHVPWVFDADGGLGPDVEVAIEAYSGRLARHDRLSVAPGQVVDWPVADLPVRVETTADGVVLHAGGTAHALAHDWTPVRLTPSQGFWVRRVGEDALVRTGTWTVRTGGTNTALAERLANAPVFAGESVGSLYRAGLFGPRLAEGGDGTAEREFLTSVDRVVESFTAAAELVVEGHDADLVVVYLPWTDDVGHEVLGWCDRQAATYRPDIADRVRDLLRHCYRAADAVLGTALRRAGEHDTVLLSADHGMVGSTELLHVNEVLVAAGLAEADPARSRVVYHPANNGSLRVNRAVVPAELVDATMRRAMAVLLDLGPSVVTGFLDERARPITDPAEVVYLVLHDDYQPSAVLDGGPALRPMVKTGSHVVNTGSDRLLATVAAAGPGIPAGVDLGTVDNTLAARIARHQLGVGDRPTDFPFRSKTLSDTLESLLTVPPSDLVATRHRSVTTFLAERDLEPRWLNAFMLERVGDGELLLTSSPVHGLANETSDLDFIRIQEGAIDGPRISTKIFERGHHLEVVSFARGELKRNLDELAALAAQPPGELVAGFRTWDKRFEPRRKQTERIVNGITLDGHAPYLQSLPALGKVWSRAALHTAVEQVAHLCLAEAAGELRGRVGYAYNVLLHLMDSVLSLHGDVYTTRKWYLLRWARFVRTGAWHDDAYRAAGEAIERARKSLSAALTAGTSVRLAEDYVALVSAVARATGVTEDVTVRTALAEGAAYHHFLPGSELLSADGSSVLMTGRVDETPVALAALPTVSAEAATTGLRAVRAGVAKTTVEYQDRSGA